MQYVLLTLGLAALAIYPVLLVTFIATGATEKEVHPHGMPS